MEIWDGWYKEGVFNGIHFRLGFILVIDQGYGLGLYTLICMFFWELLTYAGGDILLAQMVTVYLPKSTAIRTGKLRIFITQNIIYVIMENFKKQGEEKRAIHQRSKRSIFRGN